MADHDGERSGGGDGRRWCWWLLGLSACVAIALGGSLWFRTVHGGRPRPVRPAIAATRDPSGPPTDNSLLLLARDGARVAAGRALFAQDCAVCHGARGQGLVGPNLTDGAWLHGGRPLEILATVAAGVPARGMAAWEPQLGPRGVQTVVAYVLTLRGTNVPGKPAEGLPVGAKPELVRVEGER